jgi:CubicO group peptidase (beta-lactamase class C family)
MRIERTLREQLKEGCSEGVFPGASACVGRWCDGVWIYADFCSGLLGEGLGPVTNDAVYDLASLTKPWVATAALRLHQFGVFALDEGVASLVAEAEGMPIGDRTWEEVLTHRAGLAAWVPFYETLPHQPGSDEARAWILAELLQHWDRESVGSPVYSDLGYILAGIALERATGAPLQDLVMLEVAAPLGLEAEVFFATARDDQGWKARCAPTGWSVWRARDLRGEVHDDNCAALGGVAGHAGMFGSARAVARFGAAQIGAHRGRLGSMAEERVRYATAERPGGVQRLGWDGKADQESAAGDSIDAAAFGHLGFTGTSIWCDPRRQLVTVLLTNRVAVSDDNAAIRRFRPAFQDAVIQAFDGGL